MLRGVFPLVLIFLFTFGIYFLSNRDIPNIYVHYPYLAQSFSTGRFDVPTLPGWLHDKIVFNGKIYLPFPPVPALLLMPFAFFSANPINQNLVSMIIGALNVMLVFILLSRIKIALRVVLFITLFFAFGTVHFHASVIGTTWYFAHIVATFFLLLALIENFGQRRPWLLGIYLVMAILSRQTLFFSLPFFFYFLKTDVSFKNFCKRIFLFFLGMAPFVLFEAFYNFSRFGNIFDDGHYKVYLYYLNSGIPYRFIDAIKPGFPEFGFLDIRNIPLHLFTFFLMMPTTIPKFPFLKPSPYGLSVIITSPVLFYSLRSKKDALGRVTWLTVFLISFADFLHFSQGWIQFGYRFILDFLPFLLILTALGIKNLSPLKIFLLAWSIIINSWGVYWDVNHGL